MGRRPTDKHKILEQIEQTKKGVEECRASMVALQRDAFLYDHELWERMTKVMEIRRDLIINKLANDTPLEDNHAKILLTGQLRECLYWLENAKICKNTLDERSNFLIQLKQRLAQFVEKLQNGR